MESASYKTKKLRMRKPDFEEERGKDRLNHAEPLDLTSVESHIHSRALN